MAEGARLTPTHPAIIFRYIHLSLPLPFCLQTVSAANVHYTDKATGASVTATFARKNPALVVKHSAGGAAVKGKQQEVKVWRRGPA